MPANLRRVELGSRVVAAIDAENLPATVPPDMVDAAALASTLTVTRRAAQAHERAAVRQWAQSADVLIVCRRGR